MKPIALAVALATSAVLAAGCNRTDTATDRSVVPPVTPSTSSSAPPPLPATPNNPTGAGQPSDAPSAPTGTTSSSSSSSGTSSSTTSGASDTGANAPTESMSKGEESSAMPKAGQANNHSSPSMDESRGQTPQK